MPDRVAIVVGPKGLKIFKEHRGERRDLQICLLTSNDHEATSASPETHWVDFPAGQDWLELTDLDPHATYEVLSRRRHLWERVRHHAPRRTLHLEPHRLRLLLTGSGRCGTQTIAGFLDGMRFADGTLVQARHEPLSEYVVPALLAGQIDVVRAIQQGLGHNVEAAPYYALYPEAVTAEATIHLIRDGREVVQSGLNRGWYQNDSPWNRLKPRFAGDPFVQSCHFWRLACEKAEAVAAHTARLEDLSQSAAAREEFLRQLGIVADGREFPHANRGHVPASHRDWSPQQHEAFATIAGSVMDQYYPGWRAAWH
jgi:hypothetical protein